MELFENGLSLLSLVLVYTYDSYVQVIYVYIRVIRYMFGIDALT